MLNIGIMPITVVNNGQGNVPVMINEASVDILGYKAFILKRISMVWCQHETVFYECFKHTPFQLLSD